MSGKRSSALSVFEPVHRGKIVGVERFGKRLDHAAAALAEIGTERPIAELRLASPGGERRARGGNRRVFELAAADGAEKPAVRLEHNAGAGFARH